MKIIHDVPYGPDHTRLLDAYLPDMRQGQHVVVVLHGGGWTWGSKGGVQNMCTALCDRGFTVVCPEYGLSRYSSQLAISLAAVLCILFCGTLFFKSKHSDAHFNAAFFLWFAGLLIAYWLSASTGSVVHPAQVRHVAAAASWAMSETTFLNLNPGVSPKISFVGYSAGAHLAALAALHPEYLQEQGISPSRIASCVCICGPYNDNRLRAHFLGRRALKGAFPGSASQQNSFPVYHAHSSAPPMLIVTCAQDFTLRRHALDMFTALKERGAHCVEAYHVPNCNHFQVKTGWQQGGKRSALAERVAQFIWLYCSS